VLQSNGASVAPSFAEAGGGGMWELVQAVNQTTAVAAISFTGLDFAAYDYRLVGDLVLPASPGIRCGHGASPTWITGSAYRFVADDTNTSVTTTYFPVSMVGKVIIDMHCCALSATEFVMDNHNRLYASTTPVTSDAAFGGGYVATTTIATAIQIMAATAGITGKVSLYRRARA